MLLNSFSDLTLSLDSNRLRAVTGQSRTMTRLERGFRATEVGGLYGEVEHPALAGSSTQLDYTEAIAFPSLWTGLQDLERIVQEACPEHRVAFLADPDGFLQEEIDGQSRWECPVLSAALDRAWFRYVASSVHCAVRTAAIYTTFTETQIAQ